MLFREKLVELRQAAGLTQDALAEASGVPLTTARKYEQGQRVRVPFSAVIALAKPLGVDCLAFSDCDDMTSDRVAPDLVETTRLARGGE